MTKILLQRIGFMCYWLALGILNWFNALQTSVTWLVIIDMAFAALCLYIAWDSYRRAMEIAEDIDFRIESMGTQLKYHLDLLKLLTYGEIKSESKGQGEKQAESEEPAACNDEGEDEYAHPV